MMRLFERCKTENISYQYALMYDVQVRRWLSDRAKVADPDLNLDEETDRIHKEIWVQAKSRLAATLSIAGRSISGDGVAANSGDSDPALLQEAASLC